MMENRQRWRGVLIVALAVMALLAVWPPQSKLKPGLDLAGGSGITYSVDTEGITDEEAKGLADRVIPVIKKRIDPEGLSNVVIRSQGDTRFEIQLPLASEETRVLRDAYRKAFEALEDKNINLAVVIRALSLPEAEREVRFEQFAKTDAHKQLLKDLATAYDERQELRKARDLEAAAVAEVKASLQDAKLNTNSLDYYYQQWKDLEGEELDKALTDFAQRADKDNLEANIALLKKYLAAQAKYAAVIDKLTGGVADKYKTAIENVSKLNINVGALVEIMDTSGKDDYIARLKADFPDRTAEIDSFVVAYNNYEGVRGRLDDPEDVKRMLKGAGVLEFRILPSVANGDLTTEQAKAYVDNLKAKGPKLASDANFVWCQAEDIKGNGFPGAVAGEFADKLYVLASNKDGEKLLRKQDGKNWKLNRASPDYDQVGRRAIGFEMNEVGANMFYQLTNDNIDRQLCVLLDGNAISSARIQSAIGKRGIITGNYSQTEQADMVSKLNAGSLPARISEAPISEKTIGATIGEDNRDQGIRAGLIGLAVVIVFMIVYYSIAGSIADIALLLNMLFVLGVMAFTGATFTLAGIAGLILTIGMAVDANVLIFERIREEQDAGMSLKSALRLGYEKAFSTIFDSNLTTFITAFILWRVASEEIKGFAIVLMIGIASSMFTSLFATRTIFNALIDSGKLKNKLMMLSIVNKPNINWTGLKGVFFAVSGIVIVFGMFNFFSRGTDKYDIEFTGGTSVQVNFKDGVEMQRDEVERIVHEAGLVSAKVYSVGETNSSYEINTIETNRSTITVTPASGSDVTAESLKASIEGAGMLVKNVNVEAAGDGSFVVSTSQLAKSEMTKLLNKALKGIEYEAGEMSVDEIVNDTVIAAFGDKLERQVNLGLTASEPAIIDDKLADAQPALLGYIGGVAIDCTTTVPVTAVQMDARINDLRFKSDYQDLSWFKFYVLDSSGEEFTQDVPVTQFKYVALHPEAGSRNLSDDELKIFCDNELAKVTAAAAIETSLPRVTQINPSVGSESQTKALVAIVLSLFAIIGYIWIRFGSVSFGLAAIVALVHDVCITLGLLTACTYIANGPIGAALGVRDFKINLEIVAALLTIIGYSLNDTIVVFDRIRENRGASQDVWPELLNMSINQTLSRTLLTSFTTFIVVLVMYIWGGVGLRGFTFALLVGVVVGTYSSIAIAAPILLIGSGKKKPAHGK
ncbi:MAG: protein translocase subunit SecD [Phycisphaerae bacterium]